MANAIVGSGIILFLASLMGIPIGIAAGVYLAEFGRGKALGTAVRFTADVLNGVPSIVMGISIYSLIVDAAEAFFCAGGRRCPRHYDGSHHHAHHGRDAWHSFRMPSAKPPSASVSPNGAPLSPSALRTASPGIITGCMLAFARVAGETAPLALHCLRQLSSGASS